MIGEIRAAFAQVSRSGGISWSETRVIDMHGTAGEREAAHDEDRERGWTQLVDDPEWDNTGIGGFSFLDPIGFRYYLPAAMCRVLLGNWSGDLAFHLTLPPNPANPRHALRRGNHCLQMWSSLEDLQRQCVARFVRFMISRDEADDDTPSEWRDVYSSYWHLVE